jgi:hypothetical protein
LESGTNNFLFSAMHWKFIVKYNKGIYILLT